MISQPHTNNFSLDAKFKICSISRNVYVLISMNHIFNHPNLRNCHLNISIFQNIPESLLSTLSSFHQNFVVQKQDLLFCSVASHLHETVYECLAAIKVKIIMCQSLRCRIMNCDKITLKMRSLQFEHSNIAFI